MKVLCNWIFLRHTTHKKTMLYTFTFKTLQFAICVSTFYINRYSYRPAYSIVATELMTIAMDTYYNLRDGRHQHANVL